MLTGKVGLLGFYYVVLHSFSEVDCLFVPLWSLLCFAGVDIPVALQVLAPDKLYFEFGCCVALEFDDIVGLHIRACFGEVSLRFRLCWLFDRMVALMWVGWLVSSQFGGLAVTCGFLLGLILWDFWLGFVAVGRAVLAGRFIYQVCIMGVLGFAVSGGTLRVLWVGFAAVAVVPSLLEMKVLWWCEFCELLYFVRCFVGLIVLHAMSGAGFRELCSAKLVDIDRRAWLMSLLASPFWIPNMVVFGASGGFGCDNSVSDNGFRDLGFGLVDIDKCYPIASFIEGGRYHMIPGLVIADFGVAVSQVIRGFVRDLLSELKRATMMTSYVTIWLLNTEEVHFALWISVSCVLWVLRDRGLVGLGWCLVGFGICKVALFYCIYFPVEVNILQGSMPLGLQLSSWCDKRLFGRDGCCVLLLVVIEVLGTRWVWDFGYLYLMLRGGDLLRLTGFVDVKTEGGLVFSLGGGILCMLRDLRADCGFGVLKLGVDGVLDFDLWFPFDWTTGMGFGVWLDFDVMEVITWSVVIVDVELLIYNFALCDRLVEAILLLGRLFVYDYFALGFLGKAGTRDRYVVWGTCGSICYELATAGCAVYVVGVLFRLVVFFTVLVMHTKLVAVFDVNFVSLVDALWFSLFVSILGWYGSLFKVFRGMCIYFVFVVMLSCHEIGCAWVWGPEIYVCGHDAFELLIVKAVSFVILFYKADVADTSKFTLPCMIEPVYTCVELYDNLWGYCARCKWLGTCMMQTKHGFWLFVKLVKGLSMLFVHFVSNAWYSDDCLFSLLVMVMCISFVYSASTGLFLVDVLCINAGGRIVMLFIVPDWLAGLDFDFTYCYFYGVVWCTHYLLDATDTWRVFEIISFCGFVICNLASFEGLLNVLCFDLRMMKRWLL
eukprot:gene3307-2289_t